jgi:ribosome modulation factor
VSRTANPYAKVGPASEILGWSNGYKCRREGVAREWNPYAVPGYRKAWFEGWDAAAADIERGEP